MTEVRTECPGCGVRGERHASPGAAVCENQSCRRVPRVYHDPLDPRKKS